MFMLPIVILLMPPGPARDFMAGLWNTYKEFMLSIALKSLRKPANKADAEDIVSDSIVRLCNNVKTLQNLNEYQLQAYIFKTVLTNAIKFCKKKYGISTVDIDIIDLFESQNNDWENHIQLKEELEFVLSCIHRLPPKERDVITLKYKIELTNEEIAEIIGVSKDSVRQYLKRARDRLKKMIYDYEVTSGDSNE